MTEEMKDLGEIRMLVQTSGSVTMNIGSYLI